MRGILANKAVAAFAAFLMLVLALPLPSSASAIESQSTKFSIFEDNVAVQTIITMPGEVTGSIRVPVFPDASSIDVYADGISIPVQKEGNFIVIGLDSTQKVSLSYITSSPLDKSNFLMSMRAEDSTGRLSISVALPEGATLKKPITDMSASIYPLPDEASTDGKSLIFLWEHEDVEAGDEFSIFVMYKKSESRFLVISSLVIIIFALLAYVIYIRAVQKMHAKSKAKPAGRQSREKREEVRVVEATSASMPKQEERGKKEQGMPGIIEHLKEDEQQIARVLKQRGGSCEQGTLRVVTNFSKAHLSRLLMELESRKVVYKEKRGKKNIVFLRE